MSLFERVQLTEEFTAEDLNRVQTNIERALKRGRDFTSSSITNIVIGDVLADGDKGDITVSGSGAVWTIDNDVVTYAKMQNIATDRLIGRDTAGSGDPEELTVTGGLEFTGALGIQRSALTGDVTAAAGSNVTAFRAFLATSVLANATGAGAIPTELTASANNQVLQRVAGVLAFAQLDYSQLSGTPTLYYQTIQNTAGASLTQRTAWRASTGLTGVDAGGVRTDVTVNLSTGIAGGQSAIGGTAASENLTLSSTSHGTKGQVRLGSASYYFDEVSGALVLGAAAPGSARVIASSSQDADVYVAVANANGGTSASTSSYVSTTEDLSGSYTGIRNYGTAYATVGLLAANVGELLHTGGTANFLITQAQAAGDVVVTTTASRTERLRVASGGNVSIANLTAGGMVKATAGTGVLAIGVVGTDYFYQTIQNAGIPVTQRPAWNASTGLTATDNGVSTRTDVTVNLSTGISGGQTAYGGTGASEILYLSSTLHATKGHIVFGIPGAASGFNESIGQLYVGGAAGLATAPLVITSNSNATVNHMIANENAGTNARTGLFLGQQTGSVGGSYLQMFTYSTGFTTSGLLAANVGEILHVGSANFLIGQFGASGDMIFYTTASRTERARIASGGNVSVANLTAGGVVYATAATGVLAIGTSAQVAAGITWPTAGQVLVSSGTTTAPVGDTHFTYDTSTDLLTIAAGGTQAWYGVDGANAESVKAIYQTSTYGTGFYLQSIVSGAGTPPVIVIDATSSNVTVGGANVSMSNTQGVDISVVGTSGGSGIPQAVVVVTVSKTSAAGAILDGFEVAVSADISGTTTISTATGFNASKFKIPTYAQSGAGSVIVGSAATVYIEGPPAAGTDVTISNPYSLWIDAGEFRLDGKIATSGSAATLGNTPGATAQNCWIPMICDGTVLMVPAWTRT